MKFRRDEKNKSSVPFAIKTDFLLSLGLVAVLMSSQLTGCSQEELEDYDLQQTAYTGKIRLNMRSLGAGKILIAGPAETAAMRCFIGQNPCTTAGEGPQRLNSVSKQGGTQFFVLSLTDALVSDMTMRFEAVDQSGKSFDRRAVKFTKGTPTGPTAPSSQLNGGGAGGQGSSGPAGNKPPVNS